MNKTVVAAISVVAVLALAACSGDGDSPGDQPTGAPTSPMESPATASETVNAPGIEPLAEGAALTFVFESVPIEELAPPFTEAMYTPEPQGAVDAAYLYLALASEAYSSGVDDPADVTAIHVLATDECTYCRTHEELVTSLVEQNMRLTGWEFGLSDNAEMESYEIEDGGIVFRIPVTTTALNVWDPSGALVLEDPAREDWYRLEMFYVDGLWRVSAISVEAVV